MRCGVGGAGLLIFGIYFPRFSLKVLASGQYPPPGTRVVRDTPVMPGPSARRRRGAGIALAVMLLVLGLSVPWIPDLVIRPMIHRAGGSVGSEAVEPASDPPPAPDDPEQHAAL